MHKTLASILTTILFFFTFSIFASNYDDDNFYFAEQFADLKILRYQVPGWDDITLKQKKLAYYLTQAGYSGRDISWDQNYKHNLTIRRTLENIMRNYQGNRNTQEFKDFEEYTKRVWFSNGIHHHYSNDKILPKFSKNYFATLVYNSPKNKFPLLNNESIESLVLKLTPIIFDPDIGAKKVELDSSVDLIVNSAVNFYENLTTRKVVDFANLLKNEDDPSPVLLGLNSKWIEIDNHIIEQKYKIGGMYSDALQKVVYWLDKAKDVAETPLQRKSINLLIDYYYTGDLHIFDEFNKTWVMDTQPVVDFINGFIEVYNDPLGYKGSYESVVSIKDLELTKKFGVLSDEAPWFESHSPIMEEHKRSEVKGVSYKIINVVSESGDASPATPIGINLPNSNWIRANYGSKSVSLGNIEDAYKQSSKSLGALTEFYLPEQQEWIKKYGAINDKLTTGLHEVIGHASGKINDGVGSPAETLGSYASALEEGRADLVALYYIGDEHLVELGLTPSTDVIKAEYTSYLTNGLYRQLVRIEEGKDIEEAHMRNRQMIARWIYDHGKTNNVVELKKIDGKTFVKINDFAQVRELVGKMLREVQRIKSEGDYEAGKNLIENYGIQFDKELHKEILQRWKKLNIAPYAGFINPMLIPIIEDGEILDIKLYYPENFTHQMLYYANNYSFLPNYN